ncbi:MAG: hypothetical protein F6K26_30665 [Moorea sp. SIO2I5]|nr:hypothetical protein [Moorena sp. SIO2I5]
MRIENLESGIGNRESGIGNRESGIGNFGAVVKISEEFSVLSCCAFKLDIIQEDKPYLDAIADRGFLQNRNDAFDP